MELVESNSGHSEPSICLTSAREAVFRFLKDAPRSIDCESRTSACLPPGGTPPDADRVSASLGRLSDSLAKAASIRLLPSLIVAAAEAAGGAFHRGRRTAAGAMIASRKAARHIILSAVPTRRDNKGGIPGATDIQMCLCEALANALRMGHLPSSAILAKAAEVAWAVFTGFTPDAALHNDGTAGPDCDFEAYEGPRLIPLHSSVLTYLVNKLCSDR